MTAEAALATVNLSKAYSGVKNPVSGNYAVKDLNITVQQGDIYGFLGPNGSGKTTTIRMVLGLVRPTSGTARVFGVDCMSDRLNAVRLCGAMVDVPAFYPYLSARTNLSLLGSLIGGIDDDRVMETLALVGLYSRADSKVRTFSHGMRQRLGFAYAVLHRPKLLILDEPTNGLDPEGNWEIIQAIRALNQEEGVTVMLSSHLLSEVEQLCNRTCIVRQGTVLYEGEVSRLVSDDNVVEIEVPDHAAALAVLTQAGLSLQPDPVGTGRMAVESDDPSAVNELLVKAGIRVIYISRRKRTLREVFLRYMNS